MEPFWKNTMSLAPTSMRTAPLACWHCKAVTTNLPSTSVCSMSVTVQPIENCTPCCINQACNGRTNESYWL